MVDTSKIKVGDYIICKPDDWPTNWGYNCSQGVRAVVRRTTEHSVRIYIPDDVGSRCAGERWWVTSNCVIEHRALTTREQISRDLLAG